VHRWFVVLAMAAVVGAASTGCGLFDPGPDGRVLVIGDSLTVGADREGGLGDDHGWAWDIRAIEGLTTAKATEATQELDASGYDLVIVALGTNDFTDAEATYAGRVDAMMAALDEADRVLWVNVDAATDVLAPAADGVNPAIAAAAGRYGQLDLADWDAYVDTVEGMDALRAGDEVHYTTEGYQLRARWMEQLVDDA
jgi:lysophospholipase L1-like esterase